MREYSCRLDDALVLRQALLSPEHELTGGCFARAGLVFPDLHLRNAQLVPTSQKRVIQEQSRQHRCLPERDCHADA